MHYMTPLVYCYSIFWGYRLLKQSTAGGNWFRGLFAPVLGPILLLAPWMIGLKNPIGNLLLAIVWTGIIADLRANESSGKPIYHRLAYDEKLLFWVTNIVAVGWGVFQFF